MNRLPFGIGDYLATFKGDTPGHPFRGNQYDGGSSGGENTESNDISRPAKRSSKKKPALRFDQENIDKGMEHLQNVESGKSISADDLANKAGIGKHEAVSALTSAALSGLITQTSQTGGGTYKVNW